MIGKVFKHGNSQAVRLPKECRFNCDEVIVNKVGNAVILMPPENKWDGFAFAMNSFSDDLFSDGRMDESSQRRDSI